MALVLFGACSSQKDLPGPNGESPTPAKRAEWRLDVTECERNQIFTKYDNGAQSLTVVGKDGDACVVHVKHSVGHDWTESDCKIPRDKGTITISATDQIPGTCSLVERAFTALAMIPGTGSNLPGQLASLCGQEIHVAWCNAHSGGMR